MTEITIKGLANKMGEPVTKLIEQFALVGIEKKPTDYVSNSEKSLLLKYLHNSYGKSNSDVNSTSFQKKQKSTLSVAYGGKNKSVAVEVRKKRVFNLQKPLDVENKSAGIDIPDKDFIESKKYDISDNKKSLSEEKHKPTVLLNEDVKHDEKTVDVVLKKTNHMKEQAETELKREEKPTNTENKQKNMKSVNHEKKEGDISIASSKTTDTQVSKDNNKKNMSTTHFNKSTKREKLFSVNITSDVASESASKKLKSTASKQKKPKSSNKKVTVDFLSKKDNSSDEDFNTVKILNKTSDSASLDQKDSVSLMDSDISDKELYSTSSAVVADAQKQADIKDEVSSHKFRKKNQTPEKYNYSNISSSNLKRNKGNNSNKKNINIKNKHVFKKPASSINKEISLYQGESISLQSLSLKMSIKSSVLKRTLSNLDLYNNDQANIDFDAAQLVAEDLGYKVNIIDDDIEKKYIKSFDSNSDDVKKIPRPPVVTIMGHVDHGKTSLLDYLRKSRLTHAESGGITQSIGAYSVSTEKGNVTFLDTPGHAAFSEMRSRGSKVTDIVVLVVAADDGVKPQTIEAIKHSKASNSVIMVAVNKIDKKDVNLEKIKADLASHDVVSEDWGGDVIFSYISAKTGEGIDKFLDNLLLQAELLELHSFESDFATATVIESHLDKNKGAVVHALVKDGVLKRGDLILSGSCYGKIKLMRNDKGESILEATPSMPVEILGFSEVAPIGSAINALENEKIAKKISQKRIAEDKKSVVTGSKAASLEDLFANMKENSKISLNIVLKSDSAGSLEAISQSISKIKNDEVLIKLISTGIGPFNANDVAFASASNAILVGFNVRADAKAKAVIAKENIDTRYYSVIYDLLDELDLAVKGLLKPEYVQKIIGLAEVRDVFKTPKAGLVAGCIVLEGIMKRNASVRVLRDNLVIYEGDLDSLRRFKEDADEVKSGVECGISIKNYLDVRAGDQIEAFSLSEVKR